MSICLEASDARYKSHPTQPTGFGEFGGGIIDLAFEAVGSRSYLSQLEKGSFYASVKIVARLAGALGVEPAELLKMPMRIRHSRDR
jgi:transcriptional regulator with XRE-family HTH domain